MATKKEDQTEFYIYKIMRSRKDPETGLNEFEQSYVAERVKGKDPTQAYKDSKYTYTGSSLKQAAYRTEHRDRVQAEIQRIKRITEERQQLTREELAAYILDLLMDPEMSQGTRQKYLKLYGDICGFNNSSTLVVSGSLDISQARQDAIDSLLQECKSTKKP